jgi:hypothetical protein
MSDSAGYEINSLTANNNYVYCGTTANNYCDYHTSGVYRHNFSIITNIQNNNNIPTSFKLLQNYPNPFNPTTKIKFELPKSNYVTLKIYDAIGREIATLVNEQLIAGTYQVDWDGSNYASGVYYYQLRTGDFVETKKMVLVK